MRKQIPAGALEMLSIPGLRPDKVLRIYNELGISSLDDLEKAAKADRLKQVKGLGAALQSKILQGIEIRRSGEGQRHLHRAAVLLENAHFRRGCELIGDLAVVAEIDRLEGEPQKLKSTSQLSVWLTDKRRLGATLMWATGSQKQWTNFASSLGVKE